MQHARAPLQRDAAPTQHKRQSAQNHRGGTPTGVLSLWHEANPAARRSTITGYTRAHAEIQVSNEAGVTSFFGALGSAFPLAAVGAVCGVRWEWGKSVCVSPSCERLVPSPEASRRHVVSCSSCSPMVVQQHRGGSGRCAPPVPRQQLTTAQRQTCSKSATAYNSLHRWPYSCNCSMAHGHRPAGPVR